VTLDALRKFYAEEIAAVSNVTARGLIDAFARVPAERFLGPGPWKIAVGFEPDKPYRTTPDADPSHVYHNVVVALDAARQLNNGQPTGVLSVGIYPCAIARDPAHEVEVRRIMNAAEARRAVSLVTDHHERDDACIVHFPGSCLRG
jgi:hypothetical protein